MNKMLEAEIGQTVSQIPMENVESSWLACAMVSDTFNMNQAKDGKDGHQFDHVPHHIYHQLPEIPRTDNDIWNMNRISQHAVCYCCGTLTCCGGPTNKKDYFDEFKACHKKTCPLLNGLRIMEVEELREMGVTRPEQAPNMRRSYHRSFMKLNEFTDHVRKSKDLIEEYDYHTLVAIQTNDPTPRDRYGFKRVCSPCMNPQCSFFGVCTVREHYLNDITFTDSDTMFKYVGAIPVDRFEFFKKTIAFY
jgi:hypothetical protein